MGDSSQASASANANATATPAATTSPNYGDMALTGIGGISKALAAYNAGQYNKRVNNFNARMSGRQADEAIQVGEFEAGQRGAKGRAINAAAKAGMAGSGTVVGAGTNAAVVASNEAASQMDEATIRANALRTAFGFKAREVSYRSEARMQEQASKMSMVTTGLNTMSKELEESDPTYGRGNVRF